MNAGQVVTALMCLVMIAAALGVPLSVALHNRRERLKADKWLKERQTTQKEN